MFVFSRTNDAERITKRWNNVMNAIGCEYLATSGTGSELTNNVDYYFPKDHKMTVEWMIKEAQYWLSCYYEYGNSRCDDRLEGPEEYKAWRSETGYLVRLIDFLKKYNKKKVIGIEIEEGACFKLHRQEMDHDVIVTEVWTDPDTNLPGATIKPTGNYGFPIDLLLKDLVTKIN